MGKFQDLFKRKLADQQDVAQEAAQKKQAEAVERTGLLSEFEPKLREIVLEAFEAMQDVKWPKVKVLDGITKEPTGVTAYAFSRFGSHLTRAVIAEVVIDSGGRIAFHHPVTTVGERGDMTVVSCYPLNYEYERLLTTVERTDTPQHHKLSLNSAGEVVYSQSHGMDSADRTLYKSIPLAEYLATRAAHTVAGT